MPQFFQSTRRKFLSLFALGVITVGSLNACSNQQTSSSTPSNTNEPQVVRLDYAYYNPVSLVLKKKGWLEEELQKSNIKVEWVLSQGSNKALEFLNSSSIDFGSTSGASALVGKANGNPIKSIYIYSKPEWTALVVPANSPINSIADLKGKRIAATRGTDPFIFLLRALNEAGLSDKDVEIVPLQHADGKAALEKGDVDAWAGLDPFMAQTEVEKNSKLFYRNPQFISQGFLNVRESFAQQYPNQVLQVLTAYEKARQWAIANPDELQKIVIEEAKLSEPVAQKQLKERTNLTEPVIGDEQKQVITAAGTVLKSSGIIPESINVTEVVNTLIDPQYVNKVVKP
ncbi:aliphatic sulfonate ABC transporter substrate-binding protein [Synechococcus elongatus IITB7]|uniref:aliphatic sulfonate ABC transporter substrate-binding protein n=1 Tax=Synechococcus elongatus TaxID=32046 RepID=UPI0030D5801B